MAKRKKHRKKQHSHNKNVVKNTTTTRNKDNTPVIVKEHKPNIEEKIEAQTSQSAVFGDVRYSLVLVGAIVVVFVLFYFALQNQSFSNSVYGLIKLNNISF